MSDNVKYGVIGDDWRLSGIIFGEDKCENRDVAARGMLDLVHDPQIFGVQVD